MSINFIFIKLYIECWFIMGIDNLVFFFAVMIIIVSNNKNEGPFIPRPDLKWGHPAIFY